MDIKICNRCGKRIEEKLYIIHDYKQMSIKGKIDLCPVCYEKFLEFMKGKENGSCGISEESNENGKECSNSNEKQPSY